MVSENIKYYLLKFREEGIANLFDLLSGEIKKFNSIEEARNMFVSHYKETLQKTKSITESNHELRQDVYSGYIYYEVGPWLILEILKTFECGFHNDLVERCIQSIINDEPINHDDKLEIIRTALRIEVENFLDYAKELLQPKSILC